MASAKRSLVWLKPNYLGDAVMATPVVDSLIDSGREVTIRAEPNVLSLYEDRRTRCEQIAATKIVHRTELFSAVREIRRRRFDEAIVLDRSFRSAFVAWLSRIRVRAGHATEGRSWLLTHRSTYDLARNETESFLDLIRAIGVGPTVDRPELRLTETELGQEDRLGSQPTIGFQPGARYAEKQYPIVSLACVARAAKGMGFAVAALGGEREAPSARDFLDLAGGGEDLTGKLPIRDSMVVMSRLAAMVGSDTGLMHIAAAMGVPTVTLFGPNPASKWGHDYPPHQFLEGQYGETGSITIDEVIEAMRRAIASRRS